jgi:hypothetical protein
MIYDVLIIISSSTCKYTKTLELTGGNWDEMFVFVVIKWNNKVERERLG